MRKTICYYLQFDDCAMKHWHYALLTTSTAPKKKTDTQKEGKFVLGYKQN